MLCGSRPMSLVEESMATHTHTHKYYTYVRMPACTDMPACRQTHTTSLCVGLRTHHLTLANSCLYRPTMIHYIDLLIVEDGR